MKSNRLGHVSLVSAIALILASTFTACNPVTIDYLYVAGNKENPGQIQTFVADRVSGALSVSGSAISSGGVTPIALATSTDYTHLWALNQGDSSLVTFAVGSNGALTSGKSYTMSAEGNTPVAMALNAQGTLLYVVNRYQPGCSTYTPGAATCTGGALVVFPIGTDGTVGTAVANGSLSYWPIGVNPTAVAALPSGTSAFVTSYNTDTGLGYVYAFAATSAGVLSAEPGSPFNAGVRPTGIACTPVSRFVYVTDFAQNQLIAYTVLDGGVLVPLINGPFKTGNQPSAITIDPRGTFIYVTNELDNSVSAYAISLPTGTPSAAVNTSGSSINATGTEPVAVLVDPSFGRYVFTANFLDNSLSAFQLNPSTGTLAPAQNGPYPTVGQPAALAAIPRGNHSVQVNQP
ncbi:lactonase family protein [Acidicapsa dinghuensis]|uniref:Lactonase family protein n=1 Tax=Acidicapsa dinghuensis TaxID=2218256 RepID=A0ABW1EPS6_9BACT|nr:lactonase family protein [Acidicapsa dinghuensis]